MSEPAVLTPVETVPETDRATPSLLIDHVHVTYRVYEDRSPTLRQFVAERFKKRRYRSVKAVRGVTMKVYPGDAVGIIGRNGSGKSSLLRAVAGLLPPTKGAVYAQSVPALLGVGAVLQPSLSGRRNIIIGGTALGLTLRQAQDAVDEIVAFSELEDFIDMPMRTYSTGMKTRLQFAIATSVQPDILLIDEALAVGDAEFKKKSAARMRAMLDAAGTLLVVSHQTVQLKRLCNRIVWMDRGKIVMDGKPNKVVRAYEQATQSSEDD